MLNLEPFLDASLAIQFHVVMACAAAIVGLIIFVKPKGTHWHRLLGRGFVLTMAATALSSFFIHEIRLFGPFSPIHLISVGVLLSLWQAIHAIRHGQVVQHRKGMIMVYIGGIVVAGGFTFLPGRMMARMTYGGGDAEFPILALFLVLLAVVLLERLWHRTEQRRDAAKRH